MEKMQHSRKNLIQNLMILVLSLSAVLLIIQSGLSSLGSSSGYLSNLFATGVSSDLSDHSTPKLSAPVQIAVTGNYGRYADLTLDTTDAAFSSLGSLLCEALGSATSVSACSEKTFRESLSGTSIYYDFGTALPLSILANLMGSDEVTDGHAVRRLLLSISNDTVVLYLSDGSEYNCCQTGIPPANLSQLVNHYQLGNASFALDLKDSVEFMPYSLFLTGEQASYPVLSASSALNNQDTLLKNYGFNPHTNSRYTDSSGTEVIREGERTLRLQTDGFVVFQDHEEEAALHISSKNDVPTAVEAANESYRLLSALLDSGSGNASLCLRSANLTGEEWKLEYDYQVNGVLIRRSDGQPAAEIVLDGTAVTSCTLYFRQYLLTEKDSLLLPLTQALAIAKNHAGATLEIDYLDSGTDSVSASWLAE